MKNTLKIISLLLFAITSVSVFGQKTTVPLCDKIEIVNADLEKKLNLFSEYEGFQQALLFKENDNSYILEIVYKPKDIFKVEQKSLTKVELDAFCEKINQSENIENVLNLNQDGRTEFLISSTISGLGFYAWVTPIALQIENERPQIATYMLIGGSSFFVPFLATKNRKVTTSMARAYSIGTGTGIGHGLIIRNLMELNNDYPNQDYAKSDRRFLIAAAMGMGEGLGLMALADKYDLPVSNVSMIATGGVWGAGWGAATGSLFLSENEDYDKEVLKTSIPALIGSGAGMYLGHKVFQKMPNMTNGDVLVTNAYGILGGVASATVVDLAVDFDKINEMKLLMGSMTAATIGGMAYGLHRTSDYDYTTSEGAYIGLSEIAGGLLGIGVGYLIMTDNFESETALVSATVGATAGLLLVDSYIRKRSLKVNTSIGNFDFGFNPMGIANAFDEDKTVKTFEYYQRSTNNYIIRAAMTF
jgi:hypothetical protein